ncbi:hypothetical protein CNMCM5623_003859 [Aspergillus felis]|uniref:Uncharacterized protein n=1 Tax=Aspergillus felis TaxID=1287682 RepID=A0A8H6QTH2_9EURO|nr:hypothetical protein CNMCM5623_003859 [Aspergillus felis]KAF7179385.1 hypothetical protein CNMCM7691_008318 [Aspergillus felis]
MSRLLELPVEVLLIIYGSLETMKMQQQILVSILIDNNLPLPKSPDTTWLRDHFTPDWFWKRTESQVPDNLVDKRTRGFLTTTGIPSGICPIARWNSSLLRDFENADAERYAWDADLIFGRRLADDHSAPVNFCYCIGQLDLALAMLDVRNGTVFHFDQGAYGKNADRGIIADSVPSLLVLLGTVEASVARMGKVSSNLSHVAFEKYNDMRLFVLAALRKIMSEYDDCVEEDSMFWNAIFDTCVKY